MKKRKQTCFRDEIRKSLIFHALAPSILSLLVLVLIFTVLGIHQITGGSRRQLDKSAGEFKAVLMGYVNENKKITAQLDMDRFTNDSSYQTEAVSGIYKFLNEQEYRGDFYLFDKERALLFSTESEKHVVEHIGNYMSWNTVQRTGRESDFIFIYENGVPDDGALPAWLIFKPVVRAGNIWGYSGFVLRADKFKKNLGNQELKVLIANRFNRVFTEGGDYFQNDRGKLVEEFRSGKRLVHFNKRWYYTMDQLMLQDAVRVVAIYDCTSFLQLCVMSLLIMAALSVIITVAIYRSAGKVADKKTEIVYDLIAALDQVEKGSLDVSLNISTGDEFERIGHSFNTMIGSIRHLIMRHQELARENMLAAVQILESQFNPHFLFNTLESIRYMIKFEPGAAEKMLVSLSRMLRYSIQNGRDVVGMKDEIDFISRYLQVMLYRYGERLEYDIEMGELGEQMVIPRMALQPIVENCIKYGFGEDRDSLEIKIKAEVREGALRVSIADNGVGIDEMLLRELRENLKQSQNQTDHIGIYNVNKRIKLIYGNGYGLKIFSQKRRGTTVVLCVPYEGTDTGWGNPGCY